MGYEESKAFKMANAIFTFEQALDTNSRKLEALRDPYANYNKISIEEKCQFFTVLHKHTVNIGLIKCNKYFFKTVKFLYSINVSIIIKLLLLIFNLNLTCNKQN